MDYTVNLRSLSNPVEHAAVLQKDESIHWNYNDVFLIHRMLIK